MTIARIRIQERSDANEQGVKLEDTQKIYCRVESITSTEDQTTYCLSKTEIISDRWLETKNLKLYRSCDGSGFQLQYDCTYYSEDSIMRQETRELVNVKVDFLDDFPAQLL